MGWTQAQVSQALAEQGIRVNGRRLTDWREKGLLPELAVIRDSHGRVSYVWNQPNIVDQVKAVWELYAYYERTSRIAHLLWLLGYEVRPELVMDGICAPVISRWQYWSGGEDTADQTFDDEQEERLFGRLAQIANTIARRRERRPDGYPDLSDAAYQIYSGLSAIVDPVYPAEEVLAELAARSKSPTTIDSATEPAMIKTTEFLQRHLTPRHLATVASSATWEEFCEANEDLSIVRDIITSFGSMERVRGEMGILDPSMWTVLRNGAVAMLGPWVVVGIISLRRAGYGRRIRAYLRVIRRRMHEAAHSPIAEAEHAEQDVLPDATNVGKES